MTLIEYKKALLRFAPQETFAAGLELLGTEVKALRARLGSLDGARVVVRGGEAWLLGATIPPYQAKNAPKDYDPERTRRLLLTKQEIIKIAAAEGAKGLTIIPLKVYTKRRNIKIDIAIVRGKGKVDRREDIKKRDAARESERLLKSTS
jgi:SsrA-binding protein